MKDEYIARMKRVKGGIKTDNHFSTAAMPNLRGHPAHSETVAVLAFALAERGNKEFSADDIRRAYIRARIKPPKVVAQAIRDAKNLFEYIEPGSKAGTYKLSDHGDSTVRFDLPRVKGARNS